MAVAKRRAIDRIRRERVGKKHEEFAAEEARLEADFTVDPDDDFGDDLLRLMFVACHPVLSTDARVALTLRLLGGLSTTEIARAFLVPESTIAQRIVRAKRTLAEARVPFEVPGAADRAKRLASVLEVIYLVFNEGYLATAGDDVLRPALCEEALRLARVLAGLLPYEPEVHGLAALLEIQASRSKARVDANGEHVLLLDQDRGRWDHILIARGSPRSSAPNGSTGRWERTPSKLQSPHVTRALDIKKIPIGNASPRSTTRSRSSRLRRSSHSIVPSQSAWPSGLAAGLELVDELLDEPALRSYHLLPSVRGDLLEKLGRLSEARSEFERAAGLTQNVRDRTLLLTRAARAR